MTRKELVVKHEDGLQKQKTPVVKLSTLILQLHNRCLFYINYYLLGNMVSTPQPQH